MWGLGAREAAGRGGAGHTVLRLTRHLSIHPPLCARGVACTFARIVNSGIYVEDREYVACQRSNSYRTVPCWPNGFLVSWVRYVHHPRAPCPRPRAHPSERGRAHGLGLAAHPQNPSTKSIYKIYPRNPSAKPIRKRLDNHAHNRVHKHADVCWGWAALALALALALCRYMSSPNAKPNAKGTSTGNKWMVLPIPHKLEPQPRGWHIEQGIMSSFQRTSRNANIPLQLNFTTLPPGAEYVKFKAKPKGLRAMPRVGAVPDCVGPTARTEPWSHVCPPSPTHRRGWVRREARGSGAIAIQRHVERLVGRYIEIKKGTPMMQYVC